MLNPEVIQQAVALAESWQNRANELLTSEERGIQEQMKRLLTHPLDKVILSKLIDQSFRSHDSERIAEQVLSILKRYGTPDFFSRVDKLLIQMFLGMGRHFPALTVPSMKAKVRSASSRAVIPGEEKPFKAHLLERKRQAVPMNINHLGEALLGETEAQRRLNMYLRDLRSPEIETISIKISTMSSQINPLAFDYTVGILKDRLSAIYHEAMQHHFVRADGTRAPKFVNLDMEEYKDMGITCQAFIRTLEQIQFRYYSAGIALQAYLPDAHLVQKELTEWARKRIAAGGAPIKIRIVKGANMEMEKVASSLSNWPSTPYDSKLEVDANYKRMVSYGMNPNHIEAVRLGIASHNLFDLGYACILAQANQVTDHFVFEMLEGMADHVQRAIHEISGEVLLYAPVAAREEFINAIAYLIRRLDENTSPENFLRYAPHLHVDSPEWNALKEQFIASCRLRDSVYIGPNRTQDRNTESAALLTSGFHTNGFQNEPDTDWSLAANRQWAASIRSRWEKGAGHKPIHVPLVIGGEEIFENREYHDICDPNQYKENVLIGQSALAGKTDIERAVVTAREDPEGWRNLPPARRHRMLARVAVCLKEARGNLIGAAAAETGKLFTETDSEVSEAIDFVEYYPFSARDCQQLETVDACGKGVGLVISPWNFPVAIPCGGITAALAAGNTVVFKPATDAALTAWELCKCFWEAGVTKHTLQFVPCTGSTAGEMLTRHPGIDFLIFTGGTDTGLSILQGNPALYMAAETGGKNATIVTDMADRDQAIKNVIHSAFSNSGQKCSATSLLILEKPVYEDVHFRAQLVDAAESLLVGPAWQFRNRMGPLIRPPQGSLMRALTALEPGESWALKPKMLEGSPHLWSPGIKWDVQPGSITHKTEFFGPLLAVMQAKDLRHAVALANETGYGLTSGLESLDDREQEIWKDAVNAGNLYINRGTTGAIVLRQPFGGMGKSSIGPGLKAGGPDYVGQFMDFHDIAFPRIDALDRGHPLLHLAAEWENKIRWGKLETLKDDLAKTARAIKSYLYQAQTRFGKPKDYVHLRGQDNILRHLPAGKVVVRLHGKDSLFEILARTAAAHIAGCKHILSIPYHLESDELVGILKAIEGGQLVEEGKMVYQDDLELVEMLPEWDRLRYAGPDRVPDAVLEAASKSGFHISRSSVSMEGRIELLHYYRQQSVCHDYHRYGNLGGRAAAFAD